MSAMTALGVFYLLVAAACALWLLWQWAHDEGQERVVRLHRQRCRRHGGQR